MQLSHESYRTRWIVLVCAWALSATILGLQSMLVSEYLFLAKNLGMRGAAAVNTPMQEAYPAFAADGQTWVRHALSLLEGDQIQLRHTTIDNAPLGREVHWNSAWAWTIAGAGKVHHLFTGLPLTASVERAAVWLAPSALYLLIILLSGWVTQRAGLLAGVMVVIGMTCHDRFFEGFFPSYVDHHGLLTVAVFGMVLGGIFMGAGWWQEPRNGEIPLLPKSPEAARSAAVFSALCGACGLWVSAASMIAPLAIAGAAGVLALLLQGRAEHDKGAQFDAHTWRLWGRAGAIASVAFYLLEYFPSHLGLRLEANHPFYALAWLGGGELIAQFGQRLLAPRESRWQGWTQLIWPVVAVAIAPATIAIGGPKVFVVIDPFLARLHNDYIQEFLPLWKTLRGFDSKAIFQLIGIGSLPLLAGIATLSYRGRENSIVLWFATAATFLFTMMAWWQSRWLLNATGAQVALAILIVAVWTAHTSIRVRWIACLTVFGLLFIPNVVKRYTGSKSDIVARRVAPKDAANMLARDIAATLRASQPEGDIVLLASPNASNAIGYYGRFKTLGTLYWENNDGLKAAAAIFAAPNEQAAAKLLRERKVTHIAIVSDENFIGQYYQLLNPKAKPEDTRLCFGHQLLVDKAVPQWLQMLPYKLPDDLSSLKSGVMLFKVNFNQSLADALYSIALSQIEEGSFDAGDKTLDVLLKHVPQAYQVWLRKGELHLLRRNWPEAAEHLLKGLEFAPADQRAALAINYAGNFYRNQQHAFAVQFYRASLKLAPNPEVTCYLAWVLATSRDDALRNGPEALALAEESLKTDPTSPTYLNTVAAALAENNRFKDAVEFAGKALANARLRGDAAAAQVTEQRLALMSTGKPIRE